MIKRVEGDKDIYSVNSSKKVLSIEPTVGYNMYPVSIEYPSWNGYVNEVVGFIDTGASNTAISMKALYRLLGDAQYNTIINAAVASDAFQKDFSSAKKKNDLTGYLCVIPQIAINGVVINEFPFYLINNTERSIALIGYDFISSCDIAQIRNQNLELYNFDIKSMWDKIEGKKYLHLYELERQLPLTITH